MCGVQNGLRSGGPRQCRTINTWLTSNRGRNADAKGDVKSCLHSISPANRGVYSIAIKVVARTVEWQRQSVTFWTAYTPAGTGGAVKNFRRARTGLVKINLE